jgi:hypothetical protein
MGVWSPECGLAQNAHLSVPCHTDSVLLSVALVPTHITRLQGGTVSLHTHQYAVPEQRLSVQFTLPRTLQKTAALHTFTKMTFILT